MRFILIFFSFIFLSFCKQNKKVIDISGDCIIKHDSIDFNTLPIKLKDITLNNQKFWVTSSMSGSKKNDTTCRYKDYWLTRIYNVISKNQKEEKPERIKIIVFVKDDENKWDGEKAHEIFKSIYVEDNSIKLWGFMYVGMKINVVIELLKLEEYHKSKEIVVLYSKLFEAKFYFDTSNIVNKIEVERRCKN